MMSLHYYIEPSYNRVSYKEGSIMREYRVDIGSETFLVHDTENYKAKIKGVKLYMANCPGRYTFAYLMSVARVHLTHPNVSGRKPVMGFRLL